MKINSSVFIIEGISYKNGKFTEIAMHFVIKHHTIGRCNFVYHLAARKGHVHRRALRSATCATLCYYIWLWLFTSVLSLTSKLHFLLAQVYGFKRPMEIAMVYIGILLIIQSCTAILTDAIGCVAVEQNHTLDGWACQPFRHNNITNVPYHHCTLACMQNHECQAFIYDKTRELCMILNAPCLWTQPYTDHIYGISKPPCFSWEQHTKDYPFYWYYEGSLRSYIGRLLHGGDMLVGKVTAGFFTVDPTTFLLVSSGSYEKLVVDSSCKVTWVPHDSDSGQPIPFNAVIGGVLSTTNTPLYVTRQLQGATHIVGYYNPLNKHASGATQISGRGASINNTVFEVMTVTHLW